MVLLLVSVNRCRMEFGGGITAMFIEGPQETRFPMILCLSLSHTPTEICEGY